MMMATDAAPRQAGVQTEAQALTHDTLVALVDNAGYQRLALLYVAAKLDLADAVRDGPKQSRVLAGALGVHPAALHTVLRALASLGILTHEADGSFGLAPLGRLLRTDAADSLRDQVVLEWEVFRAARDGLLQAVQTGEPAFTHVFGHGLFEHLAKYSALARTFDAHMADLTDQGTAGLLEVCRFATASRIVDVGGGSGALLARILETYPQAHGVVLDLPPVAEGARRHLAAVGLTSRCEVVGGDFLQGVPAGDTYLLSHVLHNWDDDRCVRILRNCRDAMAPAGQVLVFERMMPERITKPEPATEADVGMLVLTGGRERTEGEYRSLFAAAGLKLTRVLPTASPRCVLEGSRAAS